MLGANKLSGYYDSQKGGILIAYRHERLSLPLGLQQIDKHNDKIPPASVVQKVANKYKTVSAYKKFENHAHWVISEPGWKKIAEFVFEWINQAKTKVML